jgi:anti-sigma B factor antagonist
MTALLPTRPNDAEPRPVSMTANRIGEVAVVRADGDLDLAAVDPFARAVDDALRDRPTGLVVDLREVVFCDTVGLRMLLSTAAKARRQGCSIALAGTQPQVAAFLARVCADRNLPAYGDVGDAIEGLMFSGEWR